MTGLGRCLSVYWNPLQCIAASVVLFSVLPRRTHATSNHWKTWHRDFMGRGLLVRRREIASVGGNARHCAVLCIEG